MLAGRINMFAELALNAEGSAQEIDDIGLRLLAWGGVLDVPVVEESNGELSIS
jgi:hypothetical protein